MFYCAIIRCPPFMNDTQTHLSKLQKYTNITKSLMQRQSLQTFTKDPAHWGSNNLSVLPKFIAYLEMCQDPLHVYQYMEEKSICTFLPQYWLAKASLFFDMGDYQSCFSCLQEADSRQEVSRGDLQSSEPTQGIDISRARSEFRSKMKSEMRKFPVRGKRTFDQFIYSSNYMDNPREDEGSIKSLIKVYKDSYEQLKEQRKHLAVKAKEGLEQSWMYEHYHQMSEKEKEIEEMIASQPGEYQNFISTPNNGLKFSKKISKTVDSVELLKKKNTIEKSFKLIQRNAIEHNHEQDFQEVDVDVDTVPKTEIKRKVTFDTTFTKIAQTHSNFDRPKMARFSSFSFSFPNPTTTQPQPSHPTQPPPPLHQ